MAKDEKESEVPASPYLQLREVRFPQEVWGRVRGHTVLVPSVQT